MSDRRRRLVVATSAVVSYGAVQAVIAVGGLIRVPFLNRALGADGLGLTIAIGNLCPMLLATSGGIRLAARTLGAEAQSTPERERAGRTAALLAVGRRRGLLQLALTVAVAAAVPAHHLLNAEAIVSPRGLGFVLVATAALCAAAVPGSVAWGFLEAEDRLVAVNVLMGAAAAANVLVTVLLTRWTDSFVVYALVNVASSTVPFYLAPLLPRSVPAHDAVPDPVAATSAGEAATIGTIQNGAHFATRAMDPIVVSARLGPAPAADLGIAQRIAAITTMVPIAAQPFVTAYTARRRGEGRSVGLAGVVRLAAIYATIAAGAGVAIVLFGPAISERLADGDLDAGVSVFFALAVLGVTTSVHNAFQVAGTGPRSLRFAIRLDLAYFALNVVLSVLLVRSVGLTGPVYASVVASVVATAAWLTHYRSDPTLLEDTHR